MRRLLFLTFFGAALLVSSALRAQNYSTDWHTVAGGGGVSSAGNYSLSGTIGQPATATMSGGNFSLTGGFWSIISVVQLPGSPLLSITLAGSDAFISWPAPSSGFKLQFTSNLAATNSWENATETLFTNNGVISVTVPESSGHQFYRLVNP